jgi:hypothetical protein
MDSGEEKAAIKKKFDAISWIWDILIPDRVARSALNRSHVGVIITGDLNQKYDHRDESCRSLRVRTEAMGLYTNLAERFKHLQSEYSTWGMMRDDLVGPHMIDHVLARCPLRIYITFILLAGTWHYYFYYYYCYYSVPANYPVLYRRSVSTTCLLRP